ncbi:MAG: hypothetical protein ABIP78_13085 [Pyrinomonadaceae bacterium]
MKKVIVLSTVLGLSALGMACGDAGTNVNVNAKPANNTATMAPANNTAMAPANNTAMAPANNSAMSNANSNAMKPAANAPTNMNKPANNMNKPANK